MSAVLYVVAAAVVGVLAVVVGAALLVSFLIAGFNVPAEGGRTDRLVVYASKALWWGFSAVLIGAIVLTLFGIRP